METLFKNYLSTLNGLSKEVQQLTLITFINRASTIVIPFLSLYLIDDLEFTLKDVSWIMSAFGLGSVIGTWIGGKLTDSIGYYKVMVKHWILIYSLAILKHICKYLCWSIFSYGCSYECLQQTRKQNTFSNVNSFSYKLRFFSRTSYWWHNYNDYGLWWTVLG